MVVIALRIQEESGMEWPKIQSSGLDIVNWVGPVLIPMYLLEVLLGGQENDTSGPKSIFFGQASGGPPLEIRKKKIQKKKKNT